jgi:hypothetical protein
MGAMKMVAQAAQQLTDSGAITLAVMAVAVGSWMAALLFNLRGYRDNVLDRMERLYGHPMRTRYVKVMLRIVSSVILIFTVIMLSTSIAELAR